MGRDGASLQPEKNPTGKMHKGIDSAIYVSANEGLLLFLCGSWAVEKPGHGSGLH